MQVVAAMPDRKTELERIFEQYHRLVFRAAYRVTGNSSDAEDVLQTVFMRLLHRFAGEAPGETRAVQLSDLQPDPGPYLRRAAVNAALDVMRLRRKEARVGLETIPEPAEGRPGPERESESVEIRDRLRRAVAALHPRAAEIFVLRYYEEFSNGEIAGLLGTTEGTVAVTLYRTRIRLEQQLAK